MTTHITATGWTITVRANDGRPTFRIIARSPEGKRAIHQDRLSAEAVESYDPDREWALTVAHLKGNAS